MNDLDNELINSLVSLETYECYKGILEANCNSYAEYIALALIYSLKKSKKCFREDKISVTLNHLIYKFNCFFDSERKDHNFENNFKLVQEFINDFRLFLKEFKDILELYRDNTEVVAKLYLYYFAIIEIYTRVFNNFDCQLKEEDLQARDIILQMPQDKTLEDNLKDFDEVVKLIRGLVK